jgi:hypothetical protein
MLAVFSNTYTPVFFDVDCPEPFQNLLHRPGLKTPLTKLFAKNQVDRCTFESPSHKTLAGECNRLVTVLVPAEHDRGATLARVFFQFLEFGVRSLTSVAYVPDPCPHFSVEKYHLDNSQKCLRMRNTAPETFPDTKLVPVTKYHIGHFTIGIIFHDNN